MTDKYRANRRTVLQGGSALALGLLIPGCSTPGPSTGRIRLAPVKVSEDRIIRQVVGLRPFRRNGFRVEADSSGDMLLVHNYGHGGGGGSLSWGCAHLAADIVRDSGRSGDAVVIGAGYAGLTTARLLQRRGHSVRIIAAGLSPSLTSDVAGAIWSPGHSVISTEALDDGFLARFESTADISLRYFQSFLGRSGYGVRFLDAWQFGDRAPESDPGILVTHGQFDTQEVSPGENPAGMGWGRRYRALHIQSTIFLGRLLEDFRAAGGQLDIRRFETAAEIAQLGAPLVVNCTGLGSRELFNDENLVPIKGQLIAMMPQPEIDYAMFFSRGYMIPRDDGIMLGGSHDEGNWSLEPEQPVIDRILSAHAEMFARFS